MCQCDGKVFVFVTFIEPQEAKVFLTLSCAKSSNLSEFWIYFGAAVVVPDTPGKRRAN